jgi:hypothetical protein
MGWYGLGSCLLGWGLVEVCYEHGIEPSDFLQFWRFLEELSAGGFARKLSAVLLVVWLVS